MTREKRRTVGKGEKKKDKLQEKQRKEIDEE